MRTHDDAIQFFEKTGLHASRKKWALGDSVEVRSFPTAPGAAGGRVVSVVAWVVPRADGGWDVLQQVHKHLKRRAFAELEEACTVASGLVREAPPGLRIETRLVPTDSDQDRISHASEGTQDWVVVADGAGGITGGRRAAELVVAFDFKAVRTAAGAVDALAELDRLVSSDHEAGETAVVVVAIRDGEVFGASVGDCGAWLLDEGGSRDLTADQCRKPLLGSGTAIPVPFGPFPLSGRLLVASDGLLKYARRKRIEELAINEDIAWAADRLVSAVRLPSGKLQDDLALVLVESAVDQAIR